MSLTATEITKLYKNFVIPLTNQVRAQERHAVETNDRKGEVIANCHHEKLNEFRLALKIPFREKDMEPSVYGENGGGSGK